MTPRLPIQENERAEIVVYCPNCKRDLQRIPNAGNSANQHIPADAPCRACREAR